MPRPALDALTRPSPIHYNGWWYFGLPLELLDEVGLPMPCFIRGDDVEFGLRLNRHGIPTVGLPGVAIWHEPFYLKLQGWQGYYELRNGLVYACLHMPRPASAIALLLANRLIGHLLAYRYLDAALVLRATGDWLRGPAVYEEPPVELHTEIQALRGEHPVESLPAGRVAEDLAVPPDPRTRLGFALRMMRALLRNAVIADRDTALRRVPATDFLWFRVAAADHVAVDTGWDPASPTFRRSRATFRRQFREGATLLRRVLREGDQVARAWREAAPRLASRAAWEERFRG